MKGFGITDQGLVRSNNQDSFSSKMIGKDCLLAVVCDGMGGAAGGSIASSIAKDVYASEFEKFLNGYFSSDKKEGAEVVAIPRAMRASIASSNKFTHELSVGDKSLHGMGTTLVSALVCGKKIYVCNVGDSRAYAFYNDRSVQITKDHSYVQQLVDSGRLTEKEARSSEQKNIITRAIGVEDEVSADTFILDVKSDLRYILLCTDGLSNYITGEEMHRILFQPEDMLGFERKVRFLVELANKRGGKDNITVYLIDLTNERK